MPKFSVPLEVTYKNIFLVEAPTREQAMNLVYDTDFEKLEMVSEEYMSEEVLYEDIVEVK